MAKEVTKNEDGDVISINVQPLLMPGAIVLSTIIFSISFLLGMSTLAGGGLKLGGTGTTNPGTTNTDLGSSLTVEDLASEIGLDTGAFTQCVADKEFADEIKADTAAGSAAGVTGTPGFVVGRVNGKEVNGVLISGAQPFDVFKTAIEAALNNKLGDLDKTTYPAGKTTLEDDAVKGDAGASVAVVEFSDLECPFCQRHHNETYPTIVSDYIDNGKAMYIFRDFPLSFHEPAATDAALAAQCANKLGGADAYYKFLDLYFTNSKSNGEGLK